MTEVRGGFHRWLFRYVPAVILAEPFECFLIAYGITIGVSILNAVFLGDGSTPQLYDVLNKTLLVAWGVAFLVGSAFVGVGLTIASHKSALSPRDRRWEVAGLSIVGTALTLYGVAAPLRLPHGNPYQIITLVASVAILAAWVMAIAVRITLITSPVFLLATSRLTRIRLMKQEIQKRGPDD